MSRAPTKLAFSTLNRLADRARRKRWGLLLNRFPDLPEMRVLDLGGEIAFWRAAPVRPRELVTLNLVWHAQLSDEQSRDLPWIRNVAGDACLPPPEVSGDHFDLVISNSVLEHVGGHLRRIGFANAVHALADRHWIQTPNRYFPIEPHCMCPAVQFLPPWQRAAVLKRWPLGNLRSAGSSDDAPQTALGESRHALRSQSASLRELDRYHAMRTALSIELLSEPELRFLFPQSEILRERSMGLTKSLIAASG